MIVLQRVRGGADPSTSVYFSVEHAYFMVHLLMPGGDSDQTTQGGHGWHTSTAIRSGWGGVGWELRVGNEVIVARSGRRAHGENQKQANSM